MVLTISLTTLTLGIRAYPLFVRQRITGLIDQAIGRCTFHLRR